MTTEIAHGALFKALKSKLDNAGVWGNKVFADFAPFGTARPYLIYFLAGGGEANETKAQDADLIVSVKCVANDMATSMEGAAQISDLLNDNGEQEETTGYLDGGDDWYIINSTQGRAISLVEKFLNAEQIYHNGAQYRLRMEVK